MSTQRRDEAFRLSLLENGIDFIRSGIEYFFINDNVDLRTYKYAILHLFAGVLLILKERLRREHPALIFVKVEDQKEADAYTVDFDKVVKRLRVNAGVSISKDDEKLLRRVQTLRNRLEHYHVEIELQMVQDVVGQVIEFIYEFMKTELNEELSTHLSVETWCRISDLRRIAAIIKQHQLEDWQRRAETYRNLGEDELCELLDDTPFHSRHNPLPQERYYCEICGRETIIIPDSDRDLAICTNLDCREIYHVDYCLRCENVIIGGGTFCDFCNSYINQ